MLFVTTLNCIVVFLAYLSRFRRFEYLYEVSFLILACFLCFRYDFGNDYLSYKEMFYEINTQVRENTVEIGWYYLNRFCHYFSFYGLVFLWSLTYIFIIYRFIKKYVPQKWYWLALFVLVFDPYNLLVHASMLRQALGMVFLLVGFDFLLQRKPIHYLIIVTIACSFHSTAIVFFPLVFLMYLNVRFNKKMVLVLAGIFLSVFVYIESISDVLLEFLTGSMSEYTKAYLGKTRELGRGRAVMIKVLILMICMFQQKRFDKAGLLASKLFYIGYFFIPLSTIILMLTRVGQYFLLFGIILIPITASVCKNKIVLYAFLFLVFFITLFDYISFFHDPTWVEKYSSYRSVWSLII